MLQFHIGSIEGASFLSHPQQRRKAQTLSKSSCSRKRATRSNLRRQYTRQKATQTMLSSRYSSSTWPNPNDDSTSRIGTYIFLLTRQVCNGRWLSGGQAHSPPPTAPLTLVWVPRQEKLE
ncbi:unnamed protein product, partial [Ectocarpus fasciculatus]